MSAERPALRVVSGSPTAEELAVVTALVSAAVATAGAEGERPATPRPRGTWNDPAHATRRTLRPAPNAWRSSGW